MEQYDYSESARMYDRQVKQYDSYGHDVLFGMSYQYVSGGQKLLDIGIGTGLASEPFAKTGLKIYGLDISEDMLGACESKGFTEELRLYNMAEDSIPYPDDFFDLVLSCGVLHFIGDLSKLLADIRRVIRRGGVFSFSYAPGTSEADFASEPTAWGVPIYRHSPEYIRKHLSDNGMTIEKEQRLLIKGADKTSYNMEFSAIVARLPR